MDVAFVGLGVSGALPSVPCRRAPPAPRQGSRDGGRAAGVAMAGVAMAGRPSRRRLPRCEVKATEVEMPLESLVEVHGEYVKNLTPERLEGLRRLFPEVDAETEGLRLVHEDPPVLLLEDVLSADECEEFVESMRTQDGTFPERLGQANLDMPSWLGPLRTAFRGVPVLDWLGNPTVRWTYRSRCLLDGFLQKVRDKCGLDTSFGQANIKHYRKEQWLPVHIDYNRATMLTYLNDVGTGGHTLFPTLGIKVKPSKGSALVWPNQPALKHAGDKVLDGEKWIMFYNWPAEQNWEYDGNFEFNA